MRKVLIETIGSVIGIDVGCSPSRRSSAICRLDWTSSRVSWEITRFRASEPEREETICALVAGHRIAAAAFDGSLRRGFDIIGRYRTAERMLTRRLRPLIGKPGQSSTPLGKTLNHHANACVRHVLDHADLADAQHAVAIDAKAVVEAFPSSFLGLMINDPAALAARRGDRSDIFFRHLAANGGLGAVIEHCLPGKRFAADPGDIVNHDDRAAFVCALTALCIAVDHYSAVGDDIDGWIILPPPQFIQSVQWHLLNQNANEENAGALHICSGRGKVVPLR